MTKPSKYQTYKKAAEDLERLVSALRCSRGNVSTLSNIEFSYGQRIHIKREDGKVSVTFWKENTCEPID